LLVWQIIADVNAPGSGASDPKHGPDQALALSGKKPYAASRNRAELPVMTIPDLVNPESFALFLDFDGTLVAIADHPEKVHLDLSTRRALAELDRLLGSAAPWPLSPAGISRPSTASSIRCDSRLRVCMG
jgi:hypothetical protein